MALDAGEIGDHLQILALCARYAAAVDARDFAAVADCFTVDGTLETAVPPNLMHGRDAIETGLRAKTSRTLAAQHLVTNHLYAVDGNEATGEAAFVMYRWPKLSAADHGAVAHGGKYLDTLERTDRGWRLRHRRIEILWGPAVLMAGDTRQ
jgi:uncharacterized protein (TIGR02246 family)